MEIFKDLKKIEDLKNWYFVDGSYMYHIISGIFLMMRIDDITGDVYLKLHGSDFNQYNLYTENFSEFDTETKLKAVSKVSVIVGAFVTAIVICNNTHIPWKYYSEYIIDILKHNLLIGADDNNTYIVNSSIIDCCIKLLNNVLIITDIASYDYGFNDSLRILNQTYNYYCIERLKLAMGINLRPCT